MQAHSGAGLERERESASTSTYSWLPGPGRRGSRGCRARLPLAWLLCLTDGSLLVAFLLRISRLPFAACSTLMGFDRETTVVEWCVGFFFFFNLFSPVEGLGSRTWQCLADR